MFEFESSTSGYTCDYVDTDGGSYEMVRLAMGVEVRFSFQAPLPRLSILIRDSPFMKMTLPPVARSGSLLTSWGCSVRVIGTTLPQDIVLFHPPP